MLRIGFQQKNLFVSNENAKDNYFHVPIFCEYSYPTNASANLVLTGCSRLSYPAYRYQGQKYLVCFDYVPEVAVAVKILPGGNTIEYLDVILTDFVECEGLVDNCTATICFAPEYYPALFLGWVNLNNYNCYRTITKEGRIYVSTYQLRIRPNSYVSMICDPEGRKVEGADWQMKELGGNHWALIRISDFTPFVGEGYRVLLGSSF